MSDYTTLPEGLPVPADDGATDHLIRKAMPPILLPSTEGALVNLSELGEGRTILYFYPLSGRPGEDLPEGWDAIPGARGCATEACSFRDHFAELIEAGAADVYGVSSQDPEYQGELAERLDLPFAMLSDESLALADAMRLPTFSAPGHERLYARCTLVVTDGRIEQVFYPVFPPNEHAEEVLAWLRGRGGLGDAS
ncbi:peroxiredoxin [Leucobacter luti]|uniref:peroxiredoxin n=1 Tax=Leucobacter luti TaxID=340320 RepID=UPI003CFFA9A1